LLSLAKGAIYGVFRHAAGAVAEDIVSDTLQALPTYHGTNKASFSSWAFGIAKRKAIDALRQTKGGRRRSGSLEVAANRLEDPSPELLADLYSCISSANLTEKEVLFVRQILGKGLSHPLSAADRQRLLRLCKKVPLRDVTRRATNS
jgi:DNA-directed RNA polymerase specialized sigma24 family protein